MEDLEDLLGQELLAIQQALSLHSRTMTLVKEREMNWNLDFKTAAEGSPGMVPCPPEKSVYMNCNFDKSKPSAAGRSLKAADASATLAAPACTPEKGDGGFLRNETQQSLKALREALPPKQGSAWPGDAGWDRVLAKIMRAGNRSGAKEKGESRFSATAQARTTPLAGDSPNSQAVDLEEPLLANGRQDTKDSGLGMSALPSSKNKQYNHPCHHGEEVKERVEALLDKASITVEDYYKEEGIFQDLARSQKFQNWAMVAIVLNCFWLAIDTDFDHADDISNALPIFKIADNFFCTIFSAEVAVRFLAFKSKEDAFLFPSFLFDAALVAMMAWETWLVPVLTFFMGSAPSSSASRAATVLRILRVFRLMRAARMARLLKNIPELMIMAKGMLAAMRATATILALLAIVIYIFAIAFTQLLAGSEVAVGKFDEVLVSMNFLLTTVLCGPDADFLTSLLKAGFAHYVLFIVYLLVAQLTIMNMLIGILCQIVTDTSQDDKEQQFEEACGNLIRSLAERVDINGSGTIDKAEFEEALTNKEIACSLDDMGVDVVSISDYGGFIFRECEELSYTDFFHMVSQFRGGREVTLKDIMDLRKYIVMELDFANNDLEDWIRKDLQVTSTLSNSSSPLKPHSPPLHVRQETFSSEG